MMTEQNKTNAIKYGAAFLKEGEGLSLWYRGGRITLFDDLVILSFARPSAILRNTQTINLKRRYSDKRIRPLGLLNSSILYSLTHLPAPAF